MASDSESEAEQFFRENSMNIITTNNQNQLHQISKSLTYYKNNSINADY